MLPETVIARAAADWPELPAPDDRFRAFVSDRAVEGSELHAADLLVAYHAGHIHPIAVAAIGRMLEVLRLPLRRTGADPHQIDELLADLPGDLCTRHDGAPPRIYGYAGRGPLGAWLRVIAVRTLIKRRQRDGRAAGDDTAIAELASPDFGPELMVLRQRYAAEFRAAFAAAIESLDPEDKALLRQHHLDGVGLDPLAKLYRVHRATIARRLASARDAIVTEVRRRLVDELGVGGETVDSIIRLVRGEADLSLERYL